MATLPPNIKDISADVLPAEVFLYPVCTTRTGFAAMIEAMDNYYHLQSQRVEIIKDFLNAQEFVGNPLEQPCLKELIDELIENQPPTIHYVPQESECCCHEKEDDDMACKDCANGANMRFCDGVIQYKNPETGQWEQVPATGLPMPPKTDPNPDAEPSDNHSCWKAIGAYEAFAVAVEALFGTLTGGSTSPAFMFGAFLHAHPEILVDQSNLSLFFQQWAGIWEQEHIDEYAAMRSGIESDFICKAQSGFTKERALDDREVEIVQSLQFASISTDLQNMLSGVLFVLQPEMLKQWAHNQVISAEGECNCGQGGTSPIPTTGNCRRVSFMQIVPSWTHLNPPPDGLAPVLVGRKGGTKSGNVYTGTPYEDPDEDEYRNYEIGVLFRIDALPVTVNRVYSRHTANPATGNWIAVTWWALGTDAEAAWTELGRSPDDATTAPLPAVYNFDSGELGGSYKYLLVGVTTLSAEGSDRLVQMKDIVFEITIDGERFTAVLPDMTVCHEA